MKGEEAGLTVFTEGRREEGDAGTVCKRKEKNKVSSERRKIRDKK